MESYGRFAGVYDVFMDNVNYREWADYIIETLAQDGIRDGLVLELGCGTGYCDRDACRGYGEAGRIRS